MSKRTIDGLIFVLLGMTLAVLLQGQPQRAMAADQAQRAPADTTVSAATAMTAGAVLTQTFTLQGGWNTIYLEVNPINTSPLVDPDGDGPLPPAPALSALEAVFANLSCTDCLESVWTWNVPVSRADFIVNPSEGLWDQPGWNRYFSPNSVGPDGESQAFLTNLLTLHANTAYLVKLSDDFAGNATLTVSGRPLVSGRRWVKDSYNLSGFPLQPDATPTVQRYLAGSPLTEIYRLNKAGEWTALGPTDTLRYGEGYLVYFDATSTAPENFVAPVSLAGVLSDGLAFSSGLGKRSDSFQVQNLTTQPVAFTMSLVDGSEADVALRLTAPSAAELRTQPTQLTVPANGAVQLDFALLSADQPRAGEALLSIAAPSVGVRWLVPVSASGLSLAGLWVGDVVVNDVSESRLGATNVDAGALTIALRQRNLSGVRGAAELQEVVTGSSVATVMTITLALPTPDQVTAPAAIAAAAPYVAGYVFVDANQNGQRDNDEVGIQGVAVTLSGVGSQQTNADGRYLFENVAAGSYALSFNTPSGYVSDFDVLVPNKNSPSANAIPTGVTIDADGITAVTPDTYLPQILPSPYMLPFEDATGARVEPLLNLGLVTIHEATLWTAGPGGCSDRLQQRKLIGQVLNGQLAASLSSTAINPGLSVDDLLLGGGSDYAIVLTQTGQEVACGEIVIGAPTRMDDGTGSEFRYRILLRVGEDGRAELLPYYRFDERQRISSAAFSLVDSLAANGRVTDPAALLNFAIGIEANDPLNPYLHKYHPDHDNLDAQFNAINLDTVPSYLWEAYAVQRRIGLTLTDDPPGFSGDEATQIALDLDWGGMTWGGLYKEVVQGIHKNAITARGYFVIQHVLMAEDMETQEYD